jgi:hypothetical protein
MVNKRKAFAFALSILYFLTNAVFLHAAEASIWSDRRKSAVQRVADASGAFASLPAVGAAAVLENRVTALPAFLQQKSPSAKLSPALSDLLSRLAKNGDLRDVRLASPEAPVIVQIQDVHGRAQAQRNIAEMILAASPAVLALEGVLRPLRPGLFPFLRPRRQRRDGLVLLQRRRHRRPPNWPLSWRPKPRAPSASRTKTCTFKT